MPAGAPKKREIDKMISLGGIRITQRDYNFICQYSRVRSCRPVDIVRRIVQEFRESHPIEAAYAEQRDYIRLLAREYKASKMLFDDSRRKSLDAARALFYDFLEANLGKKVGQSKGDAIRFRDDYIHFVSVKTGLDREEAERIFVDVGEKYVKGDMARPDYRDPVKEALKAQREVLNTALASGAMMARTTASEKLARGEITKEEVVPPGRVAADPEKKEETTAVEKPKGARKTRPKRKG